MLRHVPYKIRRLIVSLTLLSFQVVVLFVLFGCALAAFIYLVKMVFTEKKSNFDERTFEYLSRHVNDINTDVMQFFSFCGSHTFLIPANLMLVFYFLFINKHRWYSIKVPVVALSSLSLMFLFKFVFHRKRPVTPLLEQAAGFSFPSGHALNSSTFYGLLIFLVWQNVKNKWLKWTLMIVLLLLIFAIGLSRVYLRVHYASDVLAGFSVGLMWLLLSLWILNKIENFSVGKGNQIIQGNDAAIKN